MTDNSFAERSASSGVEPDAGSAGSHEARSTDMNMMTDIAAPFGATIWSDRPPSPGGIVAALNEAGCDAAQLASLLEVLIDHLDDVGARVDPLHAAKLAADVARIAQGLATQLSGKLFAAEELCCAPGKGAAAAN